MGCRGPAVENGDDILEQIAAFGWVGRLFSRRHVAQRLGRREHGFGHGHRSGIIRQGFLGTGLAVGVVQHRAILHRVAAVGDKVIVDAGVILDANERIDGVLARVVLCLGDHCSDIPDNAAAGPVRRKGVECRLTRRLAVDGGNALEGVRDIVDGIILQNIAQARGIQAVRHDDIVGDAFGQS